MIVTLSMSPSRAAMVRLMPSIAIDPLYTRNGSNSAGTRTRSHQFSSPSASSERNSPVPSTCPCTICPLKRPAGESGRSRFTRAPGRSAPRLLRRSVSGATSAAKESDRRSTAVRHTPLTAMLAPSALPSSTVEQRKRSRGAAASTVPSSSIIPVNIDVRFPRELVRRNRMHRHAVYTDRIRPPPPPDSPRERQRLQPAQDLRAVVKEHAIDAARFERCPVQLAARFDHQRQVLLAREPPDQPAQVRAPARPVHHQDPHAARFQQLAALRR